MVSKLFGTMALLLAAAVPLVAVKAQAPQPPTSDQQEQAERSLSSPQKSGTEEPSSHAPTVSSQADSVFVNGMLAVAGMTQETDTAPAKFSEKNDANDKLIITAYTFKALPDDQRQAIYQGLKDEPPVEIVNAEIGTELPVAIELRALPEHIMRQVPQTHGYQFAVSDHRVLLVAPANRIVVAVFSSAPDATTGAGGLVR